ncbi:MAG: ABC transporter substrate-binding protein, partial [Vallitaleaceae bacterium]|nr:ABC transporter substrate-binding protein [Vallitaleaceae bacterium]
SSYDQELASKIAFAYDLWTNPAPGFEDEGDGWKDSYYTKFRDERAVDETLAMMYNTADVKTEYLHFVYGTSFGDFAWDVYGLTATPAEKIEAVAGTWKALIEDANK